MASSLIPATAVRDSAFFFEQERLVKIELMDLAQRQRTLQWTAQLYARRAKQLWKEEKLQELGVPQGQRNELFDSSQEDSVGEPETEAGGAAEPAAEAGDAAAEDPASMSGVKRKGTAFSQPAAAVQKKGSREKAPPDVRCVACWNLSRHKAQGVSHNPEKCSKSRFYKGPKAASVPKAGGAAEPAAEAGDAAAVKAAEAAETVEE